MFRCWPKRWKRLSPSFRGNRCIRLKVAWLISWDSSYFSSKLSSLLEQNRIPINCTYPSECVIVSDKCMFVAQGNKVSLSNYCVKKHASCDLWFLLLAPEIPFWFIGFKTCLAIFKILALTFYTDSLSGFVQLSRLVKILSFLTQAILI